MIDALIFGYLLGTSVLEKVAKKALVPNKSLLNFLRNKPHFEFISSLYMQMRFIL